MYFAKPLRTVLRRYGGVSHDELAAEGFHSLSDMGVQIGHCQVQCSALDDRVKRKEQT